MSICPNFSCKSAWHDLHSKILFSDELFPLFLSLWCTCRFIAVKQFSQTFLSAIKSLRTFLQTLRKGFRWSGGFQFGLFLSLRFSVCHLLLHSVEQKILWRERGTVNEFLQYLHLMVSQVYTFFSLAPLGMNRPDSFLETSDRRHFSEQVIFGWNFSVEGYF